MVAMRFVLSSIVLATSIQLFSSVAVAQEQPAPPATPVAPEDENVSDADKERARILFDEGRQMLADGNIAGACKKFEQSQKVRPGIGTLYNLADCNEKLGKTGTAYTLFAEVADRTKAALQTDREQKARERMTALEPKLMKIRISVPSNGKVKGITLDGEPVSEEEFNKAIISDPGEHTVVATTIKDDGEPFEETVELEEAGKTVTIAIPVAPGAKMKRRVGMIVGGGITAAVGALAIVGAGVLFSQGDGSDDTVAAAGGLTVLGVVCLAVGLPIFAVGFKKKPVRDAGNWEMPEIKASPIPDLAIGPTGGSLTWQF